MRVLLISGSTRPGSSNTLMPRKLHELDHPAVVTTLYTDMPLAATQEDHDARAS